MPHPQACPDESTLWNFLQDQLAGADAERIDDHIGGCPACQRALDRLVGSLPGRWLPDPAGAEGDAPATQAVTASLGVMFRVVSNAIEPGGPAGPVARPGSPEMPTATDGPARLHLFGEIARGGMGAIHRGRDVALGRDLAVKVLLDRHRHKPGLIRRFVMEARIAGQLQHPGTVPVHELGALADGRPYFAMKLVKGRTLEALLKERTDPSEDRPRFLGIFEQVCQTMAYAHARGIIHRDLKPANVMVGRFGEVQVMDWGLAKVLTGTDITRDGEETGDGAPEEAQEEGGELTDPGSVLGTWSYMPPEQARGLVAEVDRRSDVFGLGAILAEILTGRPPYIGPDSISVRHQAIEGRLDEVSARLEGCGADSELIQLAGRCLAPDKADRPADGGEVASAVAAYLAGVQERLQQERLARERQEVQAAEGRRRHHVLVAATLSVLLALALGVVASTIFALGERAARQKAVQSEQAALQAAVSEKAARGTAEARQAETRAVLEFMENRIIAAARPRDRDRGLGPDVTLRAAIEAAVPFVEAGFKDQPLIEARLRLTLGDSFLALGDATAAAAQYVPARTIYTKLRGPDHPDTINCIIQLGTSYQMQGRTREAARIQEEILPIARARLGPDSQQTLSSMNVLATCLCVLGRFEESMNIHRDVLAITRAKYGPDDRRTLITMGNLATVYAELVRYDEALKLRTETVERYRANVGLDDHDTLMAMHNLADTFRALGRYEDALRLDEETRSRRTALLGPAHPETLFSLWETAHDLIRLRRGADAVPLLDECLERAVGKHIQRHFWQVAHLRLQHFRRAKDAEQCRTTAELWERQRRTDATSLYEAAVCRAVTSALLREKDRTLEGKKRADEEADRAMAWLRRAVAAGIRDEVRLSYGEGFEVLRDRADFRELIAGLEAKPK